MLADRIDELDRRFQAFYGQLGHLQQRSARGRNAPVGNIAKRYFQVPDCGAKLCGEHACQDSLITNEDLGAHARNLRLPLGEHAAPPVLRQFTVGTGGATNNLGRLTEGAQKSPAHSVGIGKTSFSCNDVNR